MMQIGIVGNGRIASRFLAEVGMVDEVRAEAVYNPHTQSGERFASENGLHFYREWEVFLEVVDAVYIATPHQFHFDYAKKALSDGKHVLCEKPMVLSRDEAEELYHIARKQGTVLMEAIKTAYCPGFRKLIDVAKSGIIGDVKYIDACFTKLERKDSRELTDAKYGGSFRELGSYVMLPMLRLLGCEYVDARFESIKNEKGIDIFTKASFAYKDGCMATLTCGLGVKSEGRLMIAGTRGYLLVPAPWWKTSGFEAHFEDAANIKRYDAPFEGDGLRYEIAEFMDQCAIAEMDIQNHKREKIGVLEQESMVMAEVMDGWNRFLLF